MNRTRRTKVEAVTIADMALAFQAAQGNAVAESMREAEANMAAALKSREEHGKQLAAKRRLVIEVKASLPFLPLSKEEWEALRTKDTAVIKTKAGAFEIMRKAYDQVEVTFTNSSLVHLHDMFKVAPAKVTK